MLPTLEEFLFDRDRGAIEDPVEEDIMQEANGYIDLEEMVKAADKLGFPFGNDDDARAAFASLDAAGDGRVNESEFIKWWQTKGPDDELRQQLASKFSSRVDKLGSDAQSRGVMFG